MATATTANEAPQEMAGAVRAALGERVGAAEAAFGELTITVHRDHLLEVLRFLRDDSQTLFKCVIDICGADYPAREERFDVVYHLLSPHHNARIRVRTTAGEETPIPSAVAIWPGAEWYEREAWDMYGIRFSGHPDLRRLLTDYGFDGHPLRKDFPLTGHVEVRYDDEARRVVYEPVDLRQEFRDFDFESPWEGATYPPPDGETETPR